MSKTHTVSYEPYSVCHWQTFFRLIIVTSHHCHKKRFCIGWSGWTQHFIHFVELPQLCTVRVFQCGRLPIFDVQVWKANLGFNYNLCDALVRGDTKPCWKRCVLALLLKDLKRRICSVWRSQQLRNRISIPSLSNPSNLHQVCECGIGCNVIIMMKINYALP